MKLLPVMKDYLLEVNMMKVTKDLILNCKLLFNSEGLVKASWMPSQNS